MNRYGNHFCGGSIVDARWILTAKHCVRGSSGLRVLPNYDNNHRADYGKKEYSVSQVFRHPGRSEIDGDVALLYLSEAIPLGKKFISVKLGSTDPHLKTMMTVAGWGQSEGGFLPDLRVGLAELMDEQNCIRALGYSFNRNKMMCAGGRTGDSCFGDSGGPLLVRKDKDPRNDVQYGVVSWGQRICGRAPAAYARLTKYVPWIKERMMSKKDSLASDSN